MKVFVISEVWQMDSGDFGDTVQVFKNFEDVKKVMGEHIKDARNDFRHLDTSEEIGETYYSIWEKEAYAYNHIDIKVSEVEVQ